MKKGILYTSVCTLLFLGMLFTTGVHAQDPAADAGDNPTDSAVIDTATNATAETSEEADAHASLAEADPGEVVVLPETMSDSVMTSAALGKDLFSGATRFSNRGPSCLSCHNVAAEGVMDGGLLAKDLTHVYKRLGDAGLDGILGVPPFPAMARAYENKALTGEEILHLKHFFQFVEQTTAAGEPTAGHATFLIAGGVGLVIWMGLIFLVYSNRKKNAVKQDIFDRQIRPEV